MLPVKGQGRIIISLLVAVLVLLATTSCGPSREESDAAANLVLGSETTLTGRAILLCSQECADRGQCGTAEQGEMVLLNSSGPVTSGHDMAIQVGSAVAIDHEESRPVTEISTNELMTVVYYLVVVSDRGPGWVAEWCLGQ